MPVLRQPGIRWPTCAPASSPTPTAFRAATAARPLKPDVVLFGEYLPVDALARAEQLAAGADLMLCIGSSLEVYPVAQLPAADAVGRRREWRS